MQQRIGESDKEYEARKKRVKRQRQGVSFGFGGGGGALHRPNFCINPVGTDGTKHGYIIGQFGTAGPTETGDGTPLYEFTWQANGDFIISWGVAGDTKLTDVEAILITTSAGYADVAEWDATTTAYIFNDVDAATALINEARTEVCLRMSILPTLFIEYDFAQIKRGV